MNIDLLNNNTIKITFNFTYKKFVDLMTTKKYIIKFINILQNIPFEYYVLQSNIGDFDI